LFASFIEMFNMSLAAKIQSILTVPSVVASTIGAQFFLAAGVLILLIQGMHFFWMPLSVTRGMGVGASLLWGGAWVFHLTTSQQVLWLAVLCIAAGVAILPPTYLALLRQQGSSQSYGQRAGWLSAYHTLGFAVGGGLAALCFAWNDGLVGLVLVGLSSLLLVLSLRPSWLRILRPNEVLQ
jgi:hypothetical protein